MSARSLQSIWSDGRAAIGAWCMIPSTLTAEGLSRSGFDFVCLDAQHGLIDYQIATAMLQAFDLGTATPIVRVPWNEPSIIGRYLDAGALGVIVPMINSAAEANAAVSACRYAPDGTRSFGPLRVGLRDGQDYFAQSRERIAVIAMIETKKALADVEAIAATPGLDALFVGPFDLSVSLGLPPGDNDGTPAFDDALARIVTAAKTANIHTGILSNRALAAKRIAQGFDLVSCTTDFMTMISASVSDLSHTREAAKHA
jgi:4-hydroxy-2-oxoheptanedioate aldolase